MRQIGFSRDGDSVRRAIWGPRYPGIENDLNTLPLIQLCARQWRYCVEFAARDLSEEPIECVFELRYEDFVTNEDAVVEVVRFAGVSDIDRVVERYRTTVTNRYTGKWKQLNEADKALMHSELGRALERFSYRLE